MKVKILGILGAMALGALYGVSISTCVAAGIALDRRLYARAQEKARARNTAINEDGVLSKDRTK